MSRWEDDSMYTIGLEADDYAKLEKKYDDAVAEIETLKFQLHTATKENEHHQRVITRCREKIEVLERQAQDRISRQKRNKERNRREAEDTRRAQEFRTVNSRSGWKV